MEQEYIFKKKVHAESFGQFQTKCCAKEIQKLGDAISEQVTVFFTFSVFLEQFHVSNNITDAMTPLEQKVNAININCLGNGTHQIGVGHGICSMQHHNNQHKLWSGQDGDS